MLQIIFSCLVMSISFAENSMKPDLRSGLKELFSHKRHEDAFNKAQLNCTECHSFAVKSRSFDPLAANIPSGHLKVSPQVCHKCHLGKVEFPRVNQCTLCHSKPEQLKPKSHNLAWQARHGKEARIKPDSCRTCHQENQNSCLNCHSQKNSLKPTVHRPNYRMTHSIEARSNPAKCINCHGSINTCVKCHQGRFR